MAQSQFLLAWEAHKKNICNGLSALQQNGEFVDMTLAADGHMVKVHQVIMALASPYIKELIAMAKCPHPVILLNKMSYHTLSLILEYIYAGEVMVSIEHLSDLIEAAKELHIRGLEDMNIQGKTILPGRPMKTDYHQPTDMEEETLEDEYCYFEITSPNSKSALYQPNNSFNDVKESRIITSEIDDRSLTEVLNEEDSIMRNESSNMANREAPIAVERLEPQSNEPSSPTPNISSVGMMQYTVSNQGSLQMILNRFMYYLKHTNRDGSRQWRCVDYLANERCPAIVVTRNDVVVQRVASHVHRFHDQKILKKVRSGAIFSAIQDAVIEGESKKSSKEKEDNSKKIQE